MFLALGSASHESERLVGAYTLKNAPSLCSKMSSLLDFSLKSSSRN